MSHFQANLWCTVVQILWNHTQKYFFARHCHRGGKIDQWWWFIRFKNVLTMAAIEMTYNSPSSLMVISDDRNPTVWQSFTKDCILLAIFWRPGKWVQICSLSLCHVCELFTYWVANLIWNLVLGAISGGSIISMAKNPIQLSLSPP